MNGRSVGVFAGLIVGCSLWRGAVRCRASRWPGAVLAGCRCRSRRTCPRLRGFRRRRPQAAQQGSGPSCVADFSPSDGPGPRDGTARKIGGGVRISCPGVDEIRSFTAFLHVEWHSTGADWEIQDTSDALFGPGHDGIAYGDCRVGTWRFVVELHGTDGQGRDLIITPTASKEQAVTTCP